LEHLDATSEVDGMIAQAFVEASKQRDLRSN
jgi:hypothetical protein